MTLAQEKQLNTGYGRCLPQAQVLLKAPMSVLMMGRMNEFFATVGAAVHKHNREASPDDFIGMGYPEYSDRENGLLRLGNSALLIGAEASLDNILNTDRLRQFHFGGVRPSISPYQVEDGQKVIVFCRSRKNERNLPGEIARRIRRQKRRGRDTANLELELSIALGEVDETNLPEGFNTRSFTKESFFSIGQKRMAFTAMKPKSTTFGEVRVSTYGFSDPEAPLSFPMTPRAELSSKMFE